MSKVEVFTPNKDFFPREKTDHQGNLSELQVKFQQSYRAHRGNVAEALTDRKVVKFTKSDDGTLSFDPDNRTLTLTINTSDDAKHAAQILRSCPFNNLNVAALQINIPEGSDLTCNGVLAKALSGNIQLSKAACKGNFLLPLLAEMNASKITGFSFDAPISDKAYDALIAQLASEQFANATYLKLAGVTFTSAQMVTLLNTLKGHKKLADLNFLGSTIIDDKPLRAGLKTLLAETPSLNRIAFKVPQLSMFAVGWATVAEEVGLEQIAGEAENTYGRKAKEAEDDNASAAAPAADDGAGATESPAEAWAATAMAGPPAGDKKSA